MRDKQFPRAGPGFEVSDGANGLKKWIAGGGGLLWNCEYIWNMRLSEYICIYIYIFQLQYTSNTIFITILYMPRSLIQYYIDKSYLKSCIWIKKIKGVGVLGGWGGGGAGCAPSKSALDFNTWIRFVWIPSIRNHDNVQSALEVLCNFEWFRRLFWMALYLVRKKTLLKTHRKLTTPPRNIIFSANNLLPNAQSPVFRGWATDYPCDVCAVD